MKKSKSRFILAIVSVGMLFACVASSLVGIIPFGFPSMILMFLLLVISIVATGGQDSMHK